MQGLNGRLSLPGGSSEPGESAQCTAFRETWEETGLQLQPRELLEVFDTGFHLYRCDRDAWSGEIDPLHDWKSAAHSLYPRHVLIATNGVIRISSYGVQHSMLKTAVTLPQ